MEVGTSQHDGVQLLSSPDQRWGHSGEEGSIELREMGEWQQQVIGASRKWGDRGEQGMEDAQAFSGWGVLGGCAVQWSDVGPVVWLLGSPRGPLRSPGPPRLG